MPAHRDPRVGSRNENKHGQIWRWNRFIEERGSGDANAAELIEQAGFDDCFYGNRTVQLFPSRDDYACAVLT
jgi:hypothetical protein